MNDTGLIGVTAGVVLVTAALAVLLRENGAYSLVELALLGCLGSAVIGLVLTILDKVI